MYCWVPHILSFWQAALLTTGGSASTGNADKAVSPGKLQHAPVVLHREPKWDQVTSDLTAAGRAFLDARGIRSEVIEQNDIRSAWRSFRVGGAWQTFECLAFPYKKDEEVVNVKYRSIEGTPV
jgi:hypothetical protein